VRKRTEDLRHIVVSRKLITPPSRGNEIPRDLCGCSSGVKSLAGGAYGGVPHVRLLLDQACPPSENALNPTKYASYRDAYSRLLTLIG